MSKNKYINSVNEINPIMRNINLKELLILEVLLCKEFFLFLMNSII